MSRASLLVLLLGACGGGQQSAPPPYTPVNSPEATSSCPEQAAGAKASREQLVGEEGTAVRSEAARAVFELGECERARFEATRIAPASMELFMADVTSARDQFQTVRNLYLEVTNYGDALYTTAAFERLGDLNMSFADKVEAGRPAQLDPEDVRSITGQLRLDAETSYRSAVKAAAGAEGAEDWKKRACDGLTKLGPGC